MLFITFYGLSAQAGPLTYRKGLVRTRLFFKCRAVLWPASGWNGNGPVGTRPCAKLGLARFGLDAPRRAVAYCGCLALGRLGPVLALWCATLARPVPRGPPGLPRDWV